MHLPDARVPTIELFFDLVFVFTITQLTSLLAEDPTAVGAARMILVFGNVWWMYGGYAWLTNAVPPREPGLRLLMLSAWLGSSSSPWPFRMPSRAAASPSASGT